MIKKHLVAITADGIVLDMLFATLEIEVKNNKKEWKVVVTETRDKLFEYFYRTQKKLDLIVHDIECKGYQGQAILTEINVFQGLSDLKLL